MALATCAATMTMAQVNDTGSGTVVMTPRMSVTLPSVVQLRLAASEVVFDLGGDLQTATLACVHGTAVGDVPAGSMPLLENQAAVFPLGTGFRATTHPSVTVEGAGPASGYPAMRFDGQGAAVPGSDEDFVCYRTFLLHRFANVEAWQLTVERPVSAQAGLNEVIYIRAGGCAPSPGLEGLFPLPVGERRLLAAAGASEACPDGEVVVLAVKTHAALAGNAATRLVYTLLAPLFESTP